jgi:hypothetical protein
MEKIYNFILTKEESDHTYYKKKVSQTNIHRAHNMIVQIEILKVKDYEAVWMPAISCHPYVWQSHSLWRGNQAPQYVVGFLKFLLWRNYGCLTCLINQTTNKICLAATPVVWHVRVGNQTAIHDR